jgi:protein SCO1/2
MRGAAGVIAVTVALIACSDVETQQKPLSEPGEKVYTLTGKIVARDGGDNTVRLDHEAIPGFMEAMTMDYSVRGASVSSLPPDGARVVATLHVMSDSYWITGVKKAH